MKAFRCKYCGLGFSRKTILQVHEKSHEEGEDEGMVIRAAVKGGKDQVEVLEAEVIEHMEEEDEEEVVEECVVITTEDVIEEEVENGEEEEEEEMEEEPEPQDKGTQVG